jgi:hypothetical protein
LNGEAVAAKMRAERCIRRGAGKIGTASVLPKIFLNQQ